MTKQKLWELIEAYRMSGGSEEHHARKEQLDAVLDGLLAQHDSGQAKPEPEQEPVAWMDSDGNVSDNNDHGCFSIPLYTLQPQREWVGLTDEQIDAEHDRLFPKPAFNFDRQNVRNFARVIEAKLKQKNGFAEEENT